VNRFTKHVVVGETFNAFKEFDAFLQNVCFEIPAVCLAGVNAKDLVSLCGFLGCALEGIET